MEGSMLYVVVLACGAHRYMRCLFLDLIMRRKNLRLLGLGKRPIPVKRFSMTRKLLPLLSFQLSY